MTAAEKAIIDNLKFLDGTNRNNPNVLRLVRMYGDRITHFGGGNEEGRKPDNSFLWKPDSDNNGKLVVITPSNLKAGYVTVGGESQSSLSIGNGWRPHFRFSKPGANGYGSSPRVTVDGAGSATIAIPGKKQSFKIAYKPHGDGSAPTPPGPQPVPPPPSVKPPAASITFPAKWIPFIQGVFVVEGVNSEGKAKTAHLCAKVNGNSFGTGRNLYTYQQPAFYAVDVVDRIEHLIPHSVRGWIYVNAKGEIVQFGAQPLPPATPPPAPPKPPTPPPAPGPVDLYTRTATSLTLRQDLADACRYVDAVANNSHANGNNDHIRLTPTRKGNTWTLPRPLDAYPRGAMPNTWRLALAKGKTFPAGVTWHTSIGQTFIQTTTAPGKFYPPTTRA